MHYEYRSIPPLSLLETANLNLRFSFNGLTSALNLEAIITSLATRPNSKSIQANLLKSSLLQSILLLSTLCIDPLLTATIGGKHTSGRAALLFHVRPPTRPSLCLTDPLLTDSIPLPPRTGLVVLFRLIQYDKAYLHSTHEQERTSFHPRSGSSPSLHSLLTRRALITIHRTHRAIDLSSYSTARPLFPRPP